MNNDCNLLILTQLDMLVIIRSCLNILQSLSDVTVFLTDARGLTAAIHNTGSVYEEIGNLHGGRVSSVLVCRVYHILIDCIVMYLSL